MEQLEKVDNKALAEAARVCGLGMAGYAIVVKSAGRNMENCHCGISWHSWV